MRENHTFGKRTKHDKTELINIIIKNIKDSKDNNNKYDNIFGLKINNNNK